MFTRKLLLHILSGNINIKQFITWYRAGISRLVALQSAFGTHKYNNQTSQAERCLFISVVCRKYTVCDTYLCGAARRLLDIQIPANNWVLLLLLLRRRRPLVYSVKNLLRINWMSNENLSSFKVHCDAVVARVFPPASCERSTNWLTSIYRFVRKINTGKKIRSKS